MTVRDEIEAEYSCPYCGADFVVTGDDAVYIDHDRDNYDEVCPECLGAFRVKCVAVHVTLSVRKAGES